MTSAKSSKPDKTKIRNLPEHAGLQGSGKTWYVYFSYPFRTSDGKARTDRDIIGKVSADGTEFLPNAAYSQAGCPSWKERPAQNWRNPEMRARALAGEKVVSEPRRRRRTRPDSGNSSGEPDEETFPDDIRPFLNGKLPSPEETLELFTDTGSDSSKLLHFARDLLKEHPEGPLVATEATLFVDFSSGRLAESGQKNAVPARALLLADARTGEPVAWHTDLKPSKGNALSAQKAFWKEMGLAPERVTLCASSDMLGFDELDELCEGKTPFLFATPVETDLVKDTIDNRSRELADPSNLIEGTGHFGIRESLAFRKSGTGRRRLNLFVFRSNAREKEGTATLKRELFEFQETWKITPPRARETLRKDPAFKCFTESRGKLELNRDFFRSAVRTLGHFALLGNEDMTPGEAFRRFSYAGTFRVRLEEMLDHLLETTPVHSAEAFRGAALSACLTLLLRAKLDQHIDEAFPTPEDA